MRKLLLITVYIIALFSLICYTLLAGISSLSQELKIKASDFIKPLPPEFANKSVINILILGIGGGLHDGPNLTDSITLASLNVATNTVSTIGIPRDVWVPEIRDKINSIYAYSLNDEHKSESFDYTKSHFSTFLGVPIDGLVIVDFGTFEQIVEAIHGINITIDKGFVDKRFPKIGFENTECKPYDPNYNCRYETVAFPKGTYEINGKVALKFVRSRYSEGTDGTDFSRNSRQQIVIRSVQDKILELISMRDINSVMEAIKIIDDQVIRDISNANYLPLIRNVILSKPKIQINSHTFDPDYFEVPDYEDYDGKYVLVPKSADYNHFKSDIRRMFQLK